MRLINADEITADSPLVNAIADLHRQCGCKHHEGCLAENCRECIARFFSGHYDHLLPLYEPHQVIIYRLDKDGNEEPFHVIDVKSKADGERFCAEHEKEFELDKYRVEIVPAK